jgi:LysR substrate binding domain.
VVKQYGMDSFEFAVHETRTMEVIENVRNFKSELGVLYLNDFNSKVLKKVFSTNNIEFYELFTCDTFVYLWGGHPLAKKKSLSIEQLREYPVLSFDQGKDSSLFLAEEQLSTYDYSRIIKGNDRATMLNLMVGLNGYTLCSGIISEELNGDAYVAIPLKESEKMHKGYYQT